MKKILFVLLMMLSSLTMGTTSFRNGNELYEQLRHKETKDPIDGVKFLIGSSYVLGVVDTRFSKCNLNNVLSGQLYDTVYLYLKNNPEIRHQTASSLVEISIKEKFKCK
jgi:hypothetical protein